jgi:hypothetical protein
VDGELLIYLERVGCHGGHIHQQTRLEEQAMLQCSGESLLGEKYDLDAILQGC